MSERRHYCKFPPGQRCEQCPSKRWYSVDGRRYCDRGHEIEGFVEHAFETEDAFGQTGHVSRREKEVREKVARLLSGNASRELYLECLQLILRKQVFWLVRERALPPELETVVRDLWDLRVRNLIGLRSVDAAAGTDDEGRGESGGETSGSELMLFSSQGSGAETEGGKSDATAATGVSRARSWTTDLDARRNLPKLVDTLGLCYLGCLLMRLPVRIGDIFSWSKNNQIPYLDGVHELPKEMRARLPGRYHRALSARRSPFVGGELHKSVIELALSFHINHKLLFPPLNEPLLLLRYTRELALPAEIYAYVQGMIDFLNVDFTFPLERQKIQLLDHPDVLLVAMVVLTTKLLCPFDDLNRHIISDDDDFGNDEADKEPLPILKMNWKAWKAGFHEPPQDRLSRRDIDKLSPEEAWTMSEAKTADYLDWYQQTKINEHRLPDEMGRLIALFPLEEHHPRPKYVKGIDEVAIDERMERLQASLTRVTVGATQPGEADNEDSDDLRLGQMHATYRTVEELPEAAAAFYNKTADLAGISTSKLVKAVYILERRLDRWITMKRSEARRQQTGKGPAS